MIIELFCTLRKKKRGHSKVIRTFSLELNTSNCINRMLFLLVQTIELNEIIGSSFYGKSRTCMIFIVRKKSSIWYTNHLIHVTFPNYSFN